MWYYTRLAWLILPWNERTDSESHGELKIEHYIIEANEVKSAVAKANRILEAGDHSEEPTDQEDGTQVSIAKAGILVLEPILDPLVSGACVYDEVIESMSQNTLKQIIMPTEALDKLAQYEKEHGFPKLDVYFGDDFDKL